MNKVNQIERIKIKLRLAKNTDSFFEVSGASSHKYFVGKPLKETEVSKFEKKYNITLPKHYRDFLTKIGNGGIGYKGNAAGPYYGVLKLGDEDQILTDNSVNYLDRPPYFDEKVSKKEWTEKSEYCSDEEYDEKAFVVYAGVLFIGYAGCTSYVGLMLNGKDRGRLLQTSCEIEYLPMFFEEENFLSWYENWLDKIISGEEVFGRRKLLKEDTEEEFINRYLSHKEKKKDWLYWRFVDLAYFRIFDNVSNNILKFFWKEYRTEKDEKVKLYFLNLLTRYDYENVLEEISMLTERPFEFLRNLHLYARKKTILWKKEIDKIKKEHSDNLELMEYIKYVTKKDYKFL